MKSALASFVFIASVLAFTLSGCGAGRPTIVVSGIEVYEHVWVDTVEQVGRRASFELSCPEGQLTFSLLERQGRQPTQVGVEGCGQRALYLRPVIRSGSRTAIGPWTLDSSSAR